MSIISSAFICGSDNFIYVPNGIIYPEASGLIADITESIGEVEGEEHLRHRRRSSLLVITPTENLKCKQFYDPSSKY